MRAHALELFICSVQKFLLAACKSFYLQRAKVFIGSVQKFLFAACKSFYLQRAKVFTCSVQKFLLAACKSFYLQRAKVFICSVQKFLFAACKSFYLQRAKVFICSVQKFSFAECKRFYWQCGKVFIGSVQKFLLAVCICYLSIQEYRIIIYLLRDILIVCKFHIINSIFTALQHFYLMKVLSLLGHRTDHISSLIPNHIIAHSSMVFQPDTTLSALLEHLADMALNALMYNIN